MGFVEKLKQDLVLAAQRAVQQAAQEQAAREAREKARLQAEAIEQKRIAQGRQLANGFRLESGVGAAVAKLGEFLATPTIPVTGSDSCDGLSCSWTKLIGRGSSNGSIYNGGSDCVFDEVSWDRTELTSTKGGTILGWDEYFSIKRIRVQTCPDGTIRFHAGWGGSSTIRLEQWRCSKREEILDRALEKAFKNPLVDRESVRHGPVGLSGFG